ncbi:MAG: lysophospholipid acyltransferase family protein [Pseudonocardiales bacterium]
MPSAGHARQLWRLLVTAAILLAGALLAIAFPLLRPAGRHQALRAWSRALLGALRIELTVTGGDRFAPHGGAVLVVSNHVSWLDVVALGAVQPLRMVAKSEVRDWPMIGLLARRSGTVFVDRERLSTLPQTISAVSGALASGAAVGVFPEGTTWCGMASGRFRPAIFQAAAETATPVRPVALHYRLAGAGLTTVVAFVGSATLWQAVVLLAGVRGLVVEVELLPLLSADGVDRHVLAARAGAAVNTATTAHHRARLGWCSDDIPRPRRYDPYAA